MMGSADLSDQQKAVRILSTSNKFYTLVPHDFGSRNPPLIDNDKLLVEKIRMGERD